MSNAIRATLLYFLGSIVLILHILGFFQPRLIISSHLVTRIAIPLLFAAGILLHRTMKIPADAWKKDPLIKWGGLIFALLGLLETLLYAALMFNILARFDPKYLAEDSNPVFQLLEPRLGLLMVFSILGIMLWTPIVIGLRGEKSAGNGPDGDSLKRKP